MYPDSMFAFAAASEQLGITISEIFEILEIESADEVEDDISPAEIIEACADYGLEIDSPNSYYDHA